MHNKRGAAMKEVKTKYKDEAKKITNPSPKEIIESLKLQLEQHNKQKEYHQTMAIKAQGAIEVLTQMEEDKE